MCSFCLCCNPRLQLYKECRWIGKLLVQPHFHSCGLFIELKALRLCWHSCIKAFFLLVIKKNITLRVSEGRTRKSICKFWSLLRMHKASASVVCTDKKDLVTTGSFTLWFLSLSLYNKHTRPDKSVSKWAINFGCANRVFFSLMNASYWWLPDKEFFVVQTWLIVQEIVTIRTNWTTPTLFSSNAAFPL